MSKYIVLIALMLEVSGCNTINGMGKDIKKAGEAVEKSSK